MWEQNGIVSFCAITVLYSYHLLSKGMLATHVHLNLTMSQEEICIVLCLFTSMRNLHKAARKQGPKKKIYSHCERKLRQKVRQHFLISIPQSETRGDICLRLTSISILQTDFQLLVIHFHSFNKYLFSTNYIPAVHSLCIPFFGGTSRNAIFTFVLCNSLTLFLLKNQFYEVAIDIKQRRSEIS